jgi:hypothetical protein
MLHERGWRIVSPNPHAGSADGYRDYLHASRAELAPAKHLYTAGRTGAICRPGDGLMTFTDLDSAVAAIQTVDPQREPEA